MPSKTWVEPADFTGCGLGIDGEDGVLVDPRFNADMEAGAEATGADLTDTTYIWVCVRWVDEDEEDYDEENYCWKLCNPGEGTKVGLVSFLGDEGEEVIPGWAEEHECEWRS